MIDPRPATVVVELRDGVAIVRLANPPVNIGTATMRADLLAALEHLSKADGLRAIVLGSALADFYAGSDLKEFDGPIAAPQLPDVIAALERIEVPVVAALRGSTLGGGLEIALAADVRIAATGTVLGFPEAQLGMLPGAGGTARAARLIGVPETVRLVATSSRIDAADALALGLVDEVVEAGRLEDRAIEVAGTAAKRRLIELSAPYAPDGDVDEVVQSVVTRRTRPNVLRAIQLIREGVRLTGPEALRAERELFLELREGEESRSLRYLFFAERAASKDARSHGLGDALDEIGIAGAGTMGAAIARAAVRAGLRVALFDRDPAALERAKTALGTDSTHVRFGDRITVLDGAGLIMDAVFEQSEVKRELLALIDAALADDALIASNTSYLDLNELGSTLRDPSRFAGLHFFNPADRNPLVEVIQTQRSSERVLATLNLLARRLGKVVVPATVGEGFVANRVYAEYRGQAEFLMEDGASPAEIDAAMKAFGMPIGPFAVGDMSGLDIAWSRRQRLAESRPASQRYVAIPDRLCELGRVGVKSGAGYYDYPEGARSGVPSPIVDDVIRAERERKGVTPRSIEPDEIVGRCIAAMVVAAAEVVATGVASRGSDVDLAMVEGFGFPRWTGGPVRYAAGQDPRWLGRMLAAVHDSDPIGYRSAAAPAGGIPAPIQRLLESVR